nr:hypothetical protein [Bradyrhizobium vignae]
MAQGEPRVYESAAYVAGPALPCDPECLIFTTLGLDGRRARLQRYRGSTRGTVVRHPIDIVAMFAALWLLASMVLDALTPKELTAIMIAIAIGPAIVITAVFYYLRCPRTDFAVMFAALWLISDIAIAFISPKELPHFLIMLGFVPALLIGIVLHWQRFQRRHERLPLPSAKRG